MPFVFDSEYLICKTEQVLVLGSGKSAPSKVQYLLQRKDGKNFKRVKVIIKEVKPDAKTFRM